MLFKAFIRVLQDVCFGKALLQLNNIFYCCITYMHSIKIACITSRGA